MKGGRRHLKIQAEDGGGWRDIRRGGEERADDNLRKMETHHKSVGSLQSKGGRDGPRNLRTIAQFYKTLQITIDLIIP